MKLMTIDGNSIVNRAFYGIRSLTASDGTPTNAVYGFLTILLKLIDDESPDALCVTFDLPAPTFRHKMYDGYKAKRKGMPEELAVQLPILKEVLDALGIRRYELSGWEADDLLGTLSKKCSAEQWQCVIVTGDKDALQLVSSLTSVKHVRSRMGQTETKEYTPASFFEEYGFSAELMTDLKALMGDASDNIPGVPGIGEKTALELLRQYGKITDIYANLESLEIKEAVRKKLNVGRESAQMSYDLALIRSDVPLEINLQDCLRREIDNSGLFEIFKRLGFLRLINKFNLNVPLTACDTQTAEEGPEIIEITSPKQSAALLSASLSAEYVALRLDTEYFDSIAVSIPGERKAYLLRRNTSPDYDEILKKLLGDNIKKAGHNIKDIIHKCLLRGFDCGGWIFDTALAAYLIEPTESAYTIARISERYCGYAPSDGTDDDGQMTMLTDTRSIAATEAYAIALLCGALEKKLKENELERLFNDIELPLCPVLAEMELYGFLVDKDALVRYGDTLAERITETEKKVFEIAGEVFNINSPKQLGAILFEKLMLPAPKKTKTGYSTNIEVLEYLSGKHPIIEYIMSFRELSKLKSTYADGLLKVTDPDGRIHTRFMMTVTATGRLSSTEPNLQNIPIRKEYGSQLRKMFVAGEGNVLVDADYSQIELRLLAHIADDPVMTEAFKSGVDIHTVTASQVFGVALSDVSQTMRTRAKAVNFGIVYGISAFSLAQDINVTPKDAKAYIESYLEKYDGVRSYMEFIVENAKTLGFVVTLFGRRRYLPELKSPNFNIRSFGERVALNMPIQGTAADIMKIAMISVHRRFKSEKLKAKLILQVHDELIAECPECEADRVSLILREEMEGAAQLRVPLVADTRVGKSWYYAK